jgi:predicted phosphodiesterase
MRRANDKAGSSAMDRPGPARLGLIGDVHAEDRLLAVTVAFLAEQRLDLLLATGDIVDGPGDVARCVRLLVEHGAIVVRGNHERWLLRDDPRLSALDEATAAYLRALPATRLLDTTAGRLLLCHGVDEDDMVRLTPDSSDYDVQSNVALQGLLGRRDVALIVGGHTHSRMVRAFGRLTVVNPGALGYVRDPGFAVADLAAGIVDFYSVDEDAALLLETVPLAAPV